MINSSSPARGGKTVFGAVVGILMLDTRFPRIPGDIGNAQTWNFPVLYKVVRGTTPEQAVQGGGKGLAEPFIEAAKELVGNGADGITTNCGFLSLLQSRLADECGVPVASSSLMQVPMVQSTLPKNKRVGIITISAASLTPAHLHSAGVDVKTPIVGTDSGKEFSRAILNDEPTMDVEQARTDLLSAGKELMTKHRNIGAIVLECTNMTPYAADLRRCFGVPIYSIYNFISWFHSGLLPRSFDENLYDCRIFQG